ncbi:MAG TPA: DUF5916 domain-containing protein [Gemmatimonadales bacterium]|nr:DUF5916 domain-containing protein [Gemmatimonadales bacterium]
MPVALLVSKPAVAQAQDGATATRRVVAERVAGRAPHVDGRLEEPVWASPEPAADFVLREPTEGAPAPERTEVRFLYAEDALYIGARMYSDTPAAVRTLVARRDREIPSEQLVVSLDTRADRRTAYSFAVTPGGVRTDYFHPSDFEDARDYSFDPVWEAKTTVDSLGWTAEMRIPFTQLRYNPATEQVWGVNLVRRVPARNEEAFWSLVRRNETGWSSRMGRLEGIGQIPPARRLELAPYLAANATRVGALDPADPFSERYDATLRAGGDVKMGLGPNLTLEATFNPDFGQVEADPAEVNLTAFETFFEERRPFFIEGADLFGGRGTFYSRRIGAPPPGTAGGDYAESRTSTTILGAAKVTGRLPSGLSLGALSAVTARERVAIYDTATASYGTAEVAPLTAYGIVTARQELGRDRSTLAGAFTVVERDLDASAPLAAVVARRAYTGLVDGRLRWAGGRYDASAYLGFSAVSGDPRAILTQQRSARRYFQRPDADYVDLNPRRTRLSGITAGINHSKLGGNWLWDIDYTHESPGLELNDIGSLGTADDRAFSSNIRYRRTRPGRLFHNWSLGVFQSALWNFGGVRNFAAFGPFGSATFKNFWRTEFELDLYPRSLSDDLTRGGPLMRAASGWEFDVLLANQRGARTQWFVRVTGGRDELDGWFVGTNGSLSARPGTQWELSLTPRYLRRVASRQYVDTRGGGGAATFGGRYIFSYIEQSEVVAQLRLSYAIQPDLTLEGYVEPFASSGRYRDFGELVAAKGFDLRTYGTAGTTITRNGDTTYAVTDGPSEFSFDVPDFDVRSLRSNVVLRWEWQPGSTLFLVWQQSRLRRGIPVGDVGPDGLWDAFGAPGDHFVVLKVSYWIPVR